MLLHSPWGQQETVPVATVGLGVRGAGQAEHGVPQPAVPRHVQLHARRIFEENRYLDI